MNHNIQKIRQWSLRASFALFIPVMLSFTTTPTPAPSPVHQVEVSCASPEVSKSGQSAGSISFSWNAVNGATEYAVWYVRKSDNYTSPVTYTSNTSHTFSGLTPGNYRFVFATVCGSEFSDLIIVDELII